MIEMLLLEIDKKLKREEIDKKKVKNYSDIYSLSFKDLEEITKIDWIKETVLSTIISIYSSDKNKEEKLKLIKLITSHLDKEDETKISSSIKIVNHFEDFKNDIGTIERITSHIINSKTEKGALVASDIAINLIEELNEEDYSDELMNAGRTRISEITGFITREKDENKIEASKELLKTNVIQKLGVACYFIAILTKCENKKQVSAIIDVAKSKSLPSEHLKLISASIASKASDETLENIYELLGFARNLTEEEISSELEELMNNQKERNVARQRKALNQF